MFIGDKKKVILKQTIIDSSHDFDFSVTLLEHNVFPRKSACPNNLLANYCKEEG